MSSLNERSAFDLVAVRARVAGARGPTFWRSLEELSGNEGFQQWLHERHPQLAEMLNLDRREFLKTLGASLALAGLSGAADRRRMRSCPMHARPSARWTAYHAISPLR